MMTISANVVADALAKARDLMNDKGKHWTKGTSRKPIRVWRGEIVEYAYYSSGALTESTDDWGQIHPNPVRLEAIVALSQNPQIAAIDVLKYSDPYEEALAKIITWNDDPDRTWDEIDTAFRETEERLRN